VCTGSLRVPALHVLDSVKDEERDLTPRRKNAKMNTELKSRLDTLHVGDYVKAVGADTRGHTVTRTGRMLAPPKPVRAQRNGIPTRGWRVFVGQADEDPAHRSTWTTLFPDVGTVELLDDEHQDQARGRVTASPEKPLVTPLRDVPALPSRHRPESKIIWFGGKASRNGRIGPTADWRRAMVSYVGESRYEIGDLATDVSLLNCTGTTRIWWAPVVVELAQEDNEPTPARQWKRQKMIDFVDWVGRPVYFRYGGPAKQSPSPDGPMVRVRWKESRKGVNQLVDVETNEVVAQVHSASYIWAVWATPEEINAMPPLIPLPANGPADLSSAEDRAGAAADGDATPSPDASSAGRPASALAPDLRAWAREQGYELSDRGRVPRKIRVAYGAARSVEPAARADVSASIWPRCARRPVPENILYMAEHADTEAARSWWRRRAEALREEAD
jgi:hypothetical protein